MGNLLKHILCQAKVRGLQQTVPFIRQALLPVARNNRFGAGCWRSAVQRKKICASVIQSIVPFLIVVISMMMVAGPANASGTVASAGYQVPTSWNLNQTIGCSIKTTVTASGSLLDIGMAVVAASVGWGCANGPNNSLGNNVYSVGSIDQLLNLIKFNCYSPAKLACNFQVTPTPISCPSGSSLDATLMRCVTCPANSTKNGTICTCNDPYAPDQSATSCVQDLLTISLVGLGGEVMPGKSLAGAYAKVTDSGGAGMSGESVTLLYDVIPEDDGQPFAAHVATVSPNGGGTTGAGGELDITFTAPQAGGTHLFAASCAHCTNTVTARIKVPGCSVDDLPPIIDPEVQLFEDSPNRSDTTRLTTRMQTALSCLLRDAAAGSPSVGSAYRPPAYNQHLIEVWEKWVDELKKNKEPACAALRTKIQGHFQRHRLLESQSPVPNSSHTRGEAVDETISLPAATIDTAAAGCQLRRPLPVTDRVHFIHQ